MMKRWRRLPVWWRSGASVALIQFVVMGKERMAT